MTELLLLAGLAAAIAGLVTHLLVPLVTWLATRIHAMDEPGGRKGHASAVPRLGGVAIAFGIALGGGSVALMRWGQWGENVARADLVVLVLATGLVFLVGLVDDVMGVSALNKFLVELVAAVLITGIGWRVTVIALPGGGGLDLGAAGAIVTVLWIVGVTNAINLLDGLDGLAGGVIAIIALSILVFALLQQNLFTVILMAAMAGAAMGFLRHNWAPAKIFLGDAGSLSLGFLLAVMSLHSSIKASTAIAILVPVLALGVPVVDTLLVMAVRFLERPKGRVAGRFLRMFEADRNHLHYLLMRVGRSRRQVVTLIYLLTFASCGFAVAVALTRNLTTAMVLFTVELAAILGVRWLGLRIKARELARASKDEIIQRYVSVKPDAQENTQPKAPFA
jgi:UDP-GlcNAc:undecaprenyl-phosphate GlcNAc-1-phosphate transferase